MSKAGHKQDPPPSNTEPLPTASFPGRFVGAGGQVGPYKLLRPLGEGGFGVVYLAEQKEPVRRQVALKIVKPGMDTKQVIARFEAERQALALLDHPNIAHVFDAGTTQHGRPYFVMEHVKGVPITEYCDRERLSIEDRLRLFGQVCDAIQHAHQKGIIHRDIKPSNILVTIHENKLLPMVIDFGVAKAIAQRLTEKTLFTEQGQLIGTPEYMSPEQAEMTNLDIDTRSDIYSLGVLLYELLTGTLPFDRDTLRKAAVGEIQRIIREEEAPRPSTRLRGVSADESTQLAQRRRTDIRTLERQLYGDLDWITVKALEKDRARRYNSAAELGADIKRHLNSEPVHAGPPTVSYKLRKFIQRHRVGVTAASLVVAALVVGFVLATYGLIRARQERDRAVEAEVEAVVQQQEAEKQRNEAEKQRQAVEEQRNEAKRSLYVAHMLLARQNWEDGRVRRHWELLDVHRPQAGEQDVRDWEWYYLQALGHQNLLTLRGHNGSVRSVAWSQDSEHIASAGDDHTIRVWNAVEGRPISILRGHGGPACSVAWSPDTSRLASASDDETVKIWDWTEGVVAFTLSGHEGPVRSVTWSPDGQRLASAGEDATVRIWDTMTGEESRSLYCKSGSKPILSLAWSPDGQMLAAGHMCSADDLDGWTTVWNMAGGKHWHLRDQVGHGNVYSVAWSPDSQLVASTIERHYVNVWDVTTKQKKVVLRDHINPVLSAAWSPDGKRFVSASRDQTIKIWDLSTEEVVTTLCGHRGPVNSVAWSPNGRLLATGSGDGAIGIWDAAKTEETLSTRKYDNWVSSVSWSPDGQRLATAYFKPEVEIWDPVTGQVMVTLRGHKSRVWWVAWRPDGKRLATSSMDETVKIWHATGGPAILTLRGHKNVVTCVAWSLDGQKLASGSRDNDIIIWNATTGQTISALRGHTHYVECVEWSPDGRLLASASFDGTIRVWDVNTSDVLFIFRRPTAGMGSVAWSPDGTRLAGGSEDGRIIVWEINNGQEVFSVQGHTSAARSVTWSPNGRRLASGGGDGTVKIREGDTGQEVLSIHGHKDTVFSVSWSPDGRRLATGSFDQTAKVWDASIGYELDRPPERPIDPYSLIDTMLTAAEVLVKDGSERSFPAGRPSLNREAAYERFESLFAATEEREHFRTYLEGRLLEGSGNYRKAAIEYEKTVELDNIHPKPLVRLIWCLGALGEYVALEKRILDGLRLEATSQVEISNPTFGGANGTKSGNSSGNIPGAWRAFAEGGAVEIRTVQLPAGEFFQGSPATRAVLLRVTAFGKDQGFDNDGDRFPLSPVGEYYAEFYAKTGNVDGSVQTFNFAFPLFGQSGYLNREPGAMVGCKATGEWQRFVGPRFRDLEATRGHFSWRCVDDGGENAILIALPAVRFVLSFEDAPVRIPTESDDKFAYVRDIWEQWFILNSVALKRPFREALASLPESPASKSPPPDGSLLWVLNEVAQRNVLRINCGGEEYVSPTGVCWSRDCFFNSGHRYSGDQGRGLEWAYSEPIAGTEDDPLYQTERWFPPETAGKPHYRIPLVPGRYRVTLHFSEIFHRERGTRIFAAALEGNTILEDYEPLAAGFAAAERKTFEVFVSDGFLNFEFLPRAGNPKVSAIEIERIDSGGSR